jgi:hypothetical protein
MILSEDVREEEMVVKSIPKKIWTFWDIVDVPYEVVRCIDTWHIHCPDYDITVLTSSTLQTYIPDIDLRALPFADTPQRLSDFIRLHILHRFGGFWIDASTIMTRNLDYYHSKQQLSPLTEVVGYYIDGFTTRSEFPVIESWFIGCVPESRFIGWWKAEFMRINDFSSTVTYVENIRMNGIDLQKIGLYFGRYYLSIHVAAQTILQGRRRSIDLICLDKAEEGPFYYLFRNGWNTVRSMEDLRVRSYQSSCPILKLRNYERNVLRKNNGLIDQVIANCK